MGQPVVHFEVVGKDPSRLREFYGDLFDWKFNSIEGGPTDYATVSREDNSGDDGVGIGGGIGEGPEGYDGHVTFYVETDDVEGSMAKAEELGGTRMMGPAKPNPDMDMEIGLFNDPEGHTVGLVKLG